MIGIVLLPLWAGQIIVLSSLIRPAQTEVENDEKKWVGVKPCTSGIYIGMADGSRSLGLNWRGFVIGRLDVIFHQPAR